MKTTTLASLLLLAACASEDDPRAPAPAASPGSGAEADSEASDPESPAPPPQEGALLPLAWAHTDFGIATYLSVGQLDFGADDSLVVGSIIDDRDLPHYAPVGRVDRFDADGALLWTVELGYDEFAADFPVPDDTVQIDARAVHLAGIDHTADGHILVAFNVGLSTWNPDTGMSSSGRSYVRTYDLDGNAVGTFSVGGFTDFPAQDTTDDLVGLNAIHALDDGTIVWSGSTSRGQHPIDDITMVSEGSLGRLAADGTAMWTVVLGQELDEPNMIAPDEEIAMNVQPTLDGGLAVRGHYHGTLTIGDLSATCADRSSFVARLDLDGNAAWLATLPDSEPIGNWFDWPGMGSDTAGNLFTASYVFAEEQEHLLQIDPAGQIVSQVPIGDVSTLAVTGDDHIVIGGSVLVELGEFDVAFPGRVQVLEPDGDVTASRLFSSDPQPDEDSNAFTVATSPSGRIAVGGTFDTQIDLGDGYVPLPPGVDIAAYVAVYDQACGAAHD